MEEFAQSRGDDDLFDDEIIPIEDPPSPEKVAIQLEQVSLEPTSIPPPIEAVSAAVPAPQSTKISTAPDGSFPGFRQNLRGRGGQQTARGGAPRKPSSGLEESKWATKTTEPSKPSTRGNRHIKP